MKKNFFLSVFIFTLGLLTFSACSSDDSAPVEFYLNPDNISLSYEAGATATFTITTTGKWTITNVPSFVSVSSLSGQGTATLTLQTTLKNMTAQVYSDIIVVSVEGAEAEKSITVVQEAGIAADCYAEPSNILIMSDGFAYNWKCGSNTRYYYDKIFTLADYNRLSEDEVIEIATEGGVSDRITPDLDNYQCWYHLGSNQQYIHVTVSYSVDGKSGEVVVTPITTKNESTQPEAVVESVAYAKDNDNNYYYAWDAKKNTYCNRYYTYVAASKDKFKTYTWIEEGAYAILAWAIREELKNNAEDHDTKINSMTNVREKFMAAKLNDGTSYYEANIYADNYFQVITWGTDDKDELSGLLGGGVIDLSDSSESNKKINFKRTEFVNESVAPKKIIVNRNDIELIRVH